MSISVFNLIGDVACKATILSKLILFSISLAACSQPDSDEEKSVARFFGLKIVSAPNWDATFKIFLSSELTKTFLIFWDFSAASIDQTISGFPFILIKLLFIDYNLTYWINFV